MLRFGHRLLRPAVFLTAALWTVAASACNVPVFRYALEYWAADAYELVLFYREPLTPESQGLVETMEKTGQDGLANLVVNKANLASELPPSVRELWNAQKNPALPWLVVRYPRPLGIEPSAWAGPLTAETVRALLDSPARRDLAQKLRRGDAIVWLLLESGDKRRDEQAAQLVQAESRKLEQTLVLPDPSALDPPANTDLPSKIAFSTVRVARADPAERLLLNMLLNWNTNLASATEVMLFPVFGRGRAIAPARGEEIQPEAIREMAEFLTGPCSCLVKAMNPGYDLLLSADWNSLTGDRESKQPEPPPLVGLSQFAAAAANKPTAPSSQPALMRATPSMAPAPGGRGHLVPNLVIILGLSVLFLAATTLVLKARASRRPR